MISRRFKLATLMWGWCWAMCLMSLVNAFASDGSTMWMYVGLTVLNGFCATMNSPWRFLEHVCKELKMSIQ